jgi:hypothetical protein
MSAWELFTRMKLESRLNRKSSGASSMRNQGGLDRRLKSRRIGYLDLASVEIKQKKNTDKMIMEVYLSHFY